METQQICLYLAIALLLAALFTGRKKEGFMQPGIDNTASHGATNPLYYG
jgi:hypothetical protein